MSWLILALLTAVFWGLTYSSTQMVVKHIDPKTYLTFSCLLGTFLYSIWGLFDGSLIRDIPNFNKTFWFAMLASLSAFVASYCSVNAVLLGGATRASIVEISYPLWVVVFLWFLTGTNNLNWNVALGGLTIFAGTAIVLFGKL
jgi:uncharacterized membrane protein